MAADGFQRACAHAPQGFLRALDSVDPTRRWGRDSHASDRTTFDVRLLSPRVASGCLSRPVSSCATAASPAAGAASRHSGQSSCSRHSVVGSDPWEGCSDLAADDMAEWFADCHSAQASGGISGVASGTLADRVRSSNADLGLSPAAVGNLKTVGLVELECDESAEGDPVLPTPDRFTLSGILTVEPLSSPNRSPTRSTCRSSAPCGAASSSSTKSSCRSPAPSGVAKLWEVDQLGALDGPTWSSCRSPAPSGVSNCSPTRSSCWSSAPSGVTTWEVDQLDTLDSASWSSRRSTAPCEVPRHSSSRSSFLSSAPSGITNQSSTRSSCRSSVPCGVTKLCELDQLDVPDSSTGSRCRSPATSGVTTQSSTRSSCRSPVPCRVPKLREVERLNALDRLYDVAKVRALEEEQPPLHTPGRGAAVSEEERQRRRELAAQMALQREEQNRNRGVGDPSRVKEMEQQNRKDELLGKIREQYIKLEEEEPMGLPMLSVLQLEYHLRGLQARTSKS